MFIWCSCVHKNNPMALGSLVYSTSYEGKHLRQFLLHLHVCLESKDVKLDQKWSTIKIS